MSIRCLRVWILAVTASVVLWSGCDSAPMSIVIVDDFEIVLVEEIQQSEWPSGVYYYASERTGLDVASLEEVSHLLHEIRLKGIAIEAAWYKEGSGHCGTPYGIAMTVVVPTQLLIRVDREDDEAVPKAFSRTEQPGFFCSYYVHKFVPNP